MRFTNCIYCQEKIITEAKICKYCHSPQNKNVYRFSKFSASIVSLIMVIVAAAQLFLAFSQKAQAEQALERVGVTEARIDSTATALLKITKLSLENTYIIANSTFWIEGKDEAIKRLKQNRKELSFYYVPDSTLNDQYWRSLQDLVHNKNE